jgi:hypothetical protein
VPVFLACGVTPQTVVHNTKPELAIYQAPGHMFVADIKSALLLEQIGDNLGWSSGAENSSTISFDLMR